MIKRGFALEKGNTVRAICWMVMMRDMGPGAANKFGWVLSAQHHRRQPNARGAEGQDRGWRTMEGAKRLLTLWSILSMITETLSRTEHDLLTHFMYVPRENSIEFQRTACQFAIFNLSHKSEGLNLPRHHHSTMLIHNAYLGNHFPHPPQQNPIRLTNVERTGCSISLTPRHTHPSSVPLTSLQKSNI